MQHGVILMVVGAETAQLPMEEALLASGYQVCPARGIQCAVESLRNLPVSLILVCCPAASDACRALRQVTDLPILALLSGRGEKETVQALMAGADDCQCATIGKDEALVRVRILLRRYRQAV